MVQLQKRNVSVMVSKSTILIVLALTVGISASKISEDTLSFVIKEFQINQPMIQNKLLSQNSFLHLLKKLSINGHAVGFYKNKIHHQYHAYIIFTKISNFNWTIQTKAAVLVVSDFLNEKDLSNVNVSICDELFFIDRNSLKVYEAYIINEVKVIKYLGRFHYDTNKSKLEFMRSENYLTPMVW